MGMKYTKQGGSLVAATLSLDWRSAAESLGVKFRVLGTINATSKGSGPPAEIMSSAPY